MRTLAATCDEELTDEERNLFSVALKNVLQSLRSSIAVAKAMELRERQLANDDGAALAKGYAQKLSAELSRFCSSTIEAIERRLSTPTESSAHARVFYLKLLGDYWRYTCEVDIDADKRDEAIAHCTDAYEVGVELAATSGLTMCDPIRLGLYLNQTVFLYEIVGKHSGAIAISNACICAFESAREAIGVADVADVGEAMADAEAIVQLMRNNCVLWQRELEHERERASAGARGATDDDEIDQLLQKLHLAAR
jgi:14-3-3 protein epsilon|tara:strand:- start:700 stop:1458 length:759 start_codon:yes stop_codon:yes gene_type:complete